MLKKDEKEKKEIFQETVQELSSDELDTVSGAGNPFEDVPRVPSSPLDSDLREKA